MASKKTVTPDNLETLGAERLAAILVQLADDDAEIKRRLRLELAAQEGGDSIAAEIGKRITALKSARSFIDWQGFRCQQRPHEADLIQTGRQEKTAERGNRPSDRIPLPSSDLAQSAYRLGQGHKVSITGR